MTGRKNREQHGRTILAWLLAGLCILSTLIQVVVRLLQQTGPVSLDDWVELLGWGVAIPVLFSALAALIITYRPANRVGWLMMLPALAGVIPSDLLLANIPAPPTTLTLGLWFLLWHDNFSWVLIFFPLFLILLHFPTGRPPSPRWRFVNLLALAMVLFFAVLGILYDTVGPSSGEWSVPNPVGLLSPDIWVGPLLHIWGLGLLIVVSSSVASLVVRYRRAGAAERQQMKWLLYAGILFIIVYAAQIFSVSSGVETVGGWTNLVFVLSVLFIPTAIAIAILRYQLYDIDLLINKTLVYGTLTGTLALCYFGGIVLLQQLFRALTGQESQFAIVISTLTIAALFNPLRHRIQDFIDRRFYRRKYDAQKTLATFSASLRSSTSADLEQLTGEVVRVIEETVQPASLSIWLREEPSDVGAAGG